MDMDPNHGSTFLQNSLMSSSFYVFDEMRRNGELIDFKLTFGNRFIVGHRLILAAAIPYFRTAFSSSTEDIMLDEVEPHVLEAVVDFAYSGRMQITYENVQSILSASKFLQLNEVHNACWEFLEKMLQTKNAWEIRTLAENHGYSETTKIVDDYIRQNFEEFSESEDFLNIPYSCLEDIVSSDDVKVSTEQKVFEAVIRWVKVSPSERRSFLPDLLSKIRFAHLSTKYLKERVSCEDLVNDSMFCRLLVDKAKRYHMLPPGTRPVLGSFCTQPRIYETEFSHDFCSGNTSCAYVVCKTKSVISVKYFDIISENWINLSNFAHTFLDNIVAFNETIYIFLRETILIFNVNTLTWQLSDTVHEPSYSSGIVSHENKVYLFGGDEDLSDRVRCFDTQLQKWLAEDKMTKCCENPGVTSLGDYIYVTGGDFEGNVYKSSESYNPQTKEWSPISEMLSPRVSHGCASLKGKVYACGGYSEDYENLETGEVYDPFTNQWSFISPVKEVSWRVSLVSNNGKLYMLERMPTCPNKPINVQIYDPKYDQWEFGVPVFYKDACEMFMLSVNTPKVTWWNDAAASNNSEEALDDCIVHYFSNRTSSNDSESSDDTNRSTTDDSELSDDGNGTATDDSELSDDRNGRTTVDEGPSDKDSMESSDEF